MQKKVISALGALVVLGMFAVPNQALAQRLKIGSTMYATCVTLDCATVRFDLDAHGDVYVSWFRVKSLDINKWKFQDIVSVTDANGTAVSHNKAVSADSVLITLSGGIAPEPFAITVQMQPHASAQDLREFKYFGVGNLEADFHGQYVEFSGTVAPEPASIALLGTGLAGVITAARRRRKSGDPPDSGT